MTRYASPPPPPIQSSNVIKTWHYDSNTKLKTASEKCTAINDQMQEI